MNEAVRKVLKRLHYPIEVMLLCMLGNHRPIPTNCLAATEPMKYLAKACEDCFNAALPLAHLLRFGSFLIWYSRKQRSIMIFAVALQ